MADPNRPDPARLVLTSATRPLTVGVGTVGLVLAGVLGVDGALLPSIAVLGLTIAAWFGLTTWDALFDRRFRERVANLRRRAPEREPAPAIELPPELDRPLAAARASAERVKEAMDTAGDIVQPHLLEAWGECEVLLDEARRVAERGASLHRYLSSVDPDALARDRADLLRRGERSVDRDAAEAWRQAAGARAQQIETWRQIAGVYERIRAQLVAVGAAMDEIHARVVRIAASDLDTAATASASLQGRVVDLRREMGVLERAAADTLAEVANG